MTEVTDRNETRARITAGGWQIAWGDLINEADVIEGVISAFTGTVEVFVFQQINVQLQKFQQNLRDVPKDVINQAINFLTDALRGQRNEERDINGLGVKGGLATYHRHLEVKVGGVKIGSTKLPDNFQPYIGVRITKPISSPGPPTTPAPGSLDNRAWYKIKNTVKPGMAVDVVNDGNQERDGKLQMAAEGNFSGQHWQLRPSANSPGDYNLCTMWLGTKMCLDVYGNDKTRPHLAPAGNFSGQQWHVASAGNGTWQLTNSFSGSLVLAANPSGSELSLMDPQTSPASLWILQNVRPITEDGFRV